MFFKMSFFASLSYKCIKVWYFHDQYKASSLGTNGICNNIFDLHRVSKVAAHFQRKKCSNIHSSIQRKKVEKVLKNEAAEPYLRTCQISIVERFCIINVSKYTPEFVQDSKINLK